MLHQHCEHLAAAALNRHIEHRGRCQTRAASSSCLVLLLPGALCGMRVVSDRHTSIGDRTAEHLKMISSKYVTEH